MKNEILWKWELLCDEFEEAKLNYINIFSPLIIAANTPKPDTSQIISGLKNAEEIWDNWVEIQQKIKCFLDENI